MPILGYHFVTKRVGISVLLTLAAACTPGGQDANKVVGNAIAAEEKIVDQADDRADHLDQLGAELADQVNRSRGAQAQELRNQSDAALEEAEQVRQQGQAAGADAADRIEDKAGLLNRQE